MLNFLEYGPSKVLRKHQSSLQLNLVLVLGLFFKCLCSSKYLLGLEVGLLDFHMIINLGNILQLVCKNKKNPSPPKKNKKKERKRRQLVNYDFTDK